MLDCYHYYHRCTSSISVNCQVICITLACTHAAEGLNSFCCWVTRSWKGKPIEFICAYTVTLSNLECLETLLACQFRVNNIEKKRLLWKNFLMQNSSKLSLSKTVLYSSLIWTSTVSRDMFSIIYKIIWITKHNVTCMKFNST